MQTLRLYLHYIGASIRGQMQYPASFTLLSLAQLLATASEIVGVWALFHRFGHVGAWTFGEVAVFYGLINIAFSFADAWTRGFDVFGPEFVKTGAFDRLLLRPRSTAFQLFGHELRLSRVGRFIQGAAVLVVGVRMTNMALTPAALGLMTLAVLGAVALFTGILILQATLAFWTVESLEVANILSYGGVQAGQYPMNIYAGWFRNLLIYIVPVACVSYFPVVAALGRHDPLGAPDWILPLTPLAGFAFMALSLWVWGFGVRRYASTGS